LPTGAFFAISLVSRRSALPRLWSHLLTVDGV